MRLNIHRRFILPLAVFLLVLNVDAFAQRGRTNGVLSAIERHDVGVFVGVASYIGDFNEKNLFYKSSPLAGLLYRYNFTPYFALRAQAGYSTIKGNSHDYYGSLPGFPTGGGIEFDRSMVMIDGVGEFNFLPYTPLDKRRRNIFAPYLALGIGVNFMGSNRINNNPDLDLAAGTFPAIYGDPGTAFAQTTIFEIPIGFGMKVSPIRRLTLAGEWTLKKMFYDKIDGFTNRGGGALSLINDDWVSTITFSATYRFASNWQCASYSKKYNPEKTLRGLKDRTYKVNVMQSAAKDPKKRSVKKLEGRSENESNQLKKKKK